MAAVEDKERSRKIRRARRAQTWAPHARRQAPPRPRGHVARGSGR